MGDAAEEEAKSQADLFRAAAKKQQRKHLAFVRKIYQEGQTFVPLLLIMLAYIMMWRDNTATLLVNDAVTERCSSLRPPLHMYCTTFVFSSKHTPPKT